MIPKQREYQVRGRDWYSRTIFPWERVIAGDATWAAYTYYKNSKHHLASEDIHIWIPGPNQRLRAKVIDDEMRVELFDWKSNEPYRT